MSIQHRKPKKKIGSFLSPALDQSYIIVIQCGVGAESETVGH